MLADEVLWYSQRDGWGHLYRYDLHTGELLGQVTAGQWAVRQILHVDEAERVVYFTASGLVDADPYRRTVCRVGLDGSGFASVTDDDLDHVVTVSQNQQYFVDSASTVDTAAGDQRPRLDRPGAGRAGAGRHQQARRDRLDAAGAVPRQGGRRR